MAGTKPSGESRSRFFADVLSFGWLLPSAIAVGAGLGWLLDRGLGTSPVFAIALGLLGFVAGARQLFRESATLAAEAPEPSGEAPKAAGIAEPDGEPPAGDEPPDRSVP